MKNFIKRNPKRNKENVETKKFEIINEKRYKTVINPRIARGLLKAGYTMADIKADKNDPEGKKSLYVFVNVPGFEDYMDLLKEV